MILYSEQAEEFRSYSESYKNNPNLFRIPATNLIFLEGLVNSLPLSGTVAILEVGCGQGYYLEFAHKKLTQRLRHGRGEAANARCVGVDGSWIAIAQAEERYPAGTWIAAKLQRFLVEHDSRLDSLRYDLIVDKGGTTFMRDEEEARQTLMQIKAMLRPEGIYAYVISKSFYHDKAERLLYKDWSKGWIDLADTVFTRSEPRPDPGYYYTIFHP